ncbi:hypothetical protein [Halobellus ordinarius]|uniref:hypothetical protein n=1 Tax=Halobellus ordinarius TaxID=3075120 RepID=UPI00288082F8|nr:hypothetical protein [Halobellus sp. ZY16]
MPISEDEWESEKQWTEVERAIGEFLDAVQPRAYSVPELHELLQHGGTVTAPEEEIWCDEDDEQEPEEIEIVPMDVTEREVQAATTVLRDAEYLESKRIETAEGSVTYYRRWECAF